jgi:arginyl-tRNA synthetase
VTGKLGIHFDSWYRQSKFIASGYLDETIDVLRKKGVIVERDGVVFFETPEAVALRREGDEGWVLVDAEGEAKYLATDIAYHRLCLEDRGIDLKLDVWGANTQYHVAQMKLALPVLGIDPSRFEVVLYQYVRFLKEGVLTRMGRRTGQFLLLEDVLDAVGADVTRFFLLQRGADSQLDFDFELAVQQSNDNPVYYVQYAHARIASIFRTAGEHGLTPEDADVQLLVAPGERDLIRLCQKFPELLDEIRAHRGVHLLTVYALELARVDVARSCPRTARPGPRRGDVSPPPRRPRTARPRARGGTHGPVRREGQCAAARRPPPQGAARRRWERGRSDRSCKNRPLAARSRPR